MLFIFKKNNNRRRVRLTEGQLHNIIRNAVNQLINEDYRTESWQDEKFGLPTNTREKNKWMQTGSDLDYDSNDKRHDYKNRANDAMIEELLRNGCMTSVF